jgi:GTPase
MFVDKVQVEISAGRGGNGAVSFRHEKFVDRGGPDGGDGGNGGDVVLIASRNQNTLANFRFQKTLKAEDGQPGSKKRKHGKSGDDLMVKVPIGTAVLDESGNLLADLTEDDQRVVIAKGGHGGFGNAHFVSSTRQAPRIAEKGEVGEELMVSFELKMIADVGLVGLPNAGKSTLLSVVSNAHPEIANYPFTTLTPNLGVVDVDKDNSLLFADIPGLIEGASEGKGLGDEFLRHVERTSVLVHLIDAYQEDLVSAYKTIQNELKHYRADLSKKPQIVVLTKIEGLDEEMVKDRIKTLKKHLPPKTPLLAISAQSGLNIKDLLYQANELVIKSKRKSQKEEEENKTPVYRLADEDVKWQVKKTGKIFVITGRKIEKFASRVELNSEDGERRVKDIMKKMGIMRELERQGIEPGMTIKIGSIGQVNY